MLAIVCKTYEDVQALESYDKEGHINNNSGLHGFSASIRRALAGRFLVVCLENLRTDVDVRFPKPSMASDISECHTETEKQLKGMIWEKDKIKEDIKREQGLLDAARYNFKRKKEEFVKFLAESSAYATQ